MVAPSVLEEMSKPLVGHLDPEFIRMTEEIKSMLRTTFATENPMTFPVSGTGSAGMEFCMANLVEPGDQVLVCVNGVFGGRMAEVAARCGAEVIRVEAPWGRTIDPAQVAAALRTCRLKLVGVVHVETSTGACTPISEISRIAKEAGALVLIDTVTSLAGCPVEIDAWGVDAVYSGTQKCLSCPPGLSPVSFSSRAMEVATSRKTIEEGLENRFVRHEANHLRLKDRLGTMGLEIASRPVHQLWQLNSITVPDEVDEADVRRRLLADFGIEIGAGLGPLKGKVWRIGLMGESSSADNIDTVLNAPGQILSGNSN